MASEKDPRTYVRVHDGMPDHPKVDGISDAAFRLLVTMWCWCSRHLTDGLVPAATWQKRGKQKVRDELIAAGLVDVREDGAVAMHDYTQHQRTAEEVQAIRDSRAESGALGNHRRWHEGRGVADPDCTHCSDPKLVAKLSQTRSQNDRESSPETETETEIKGKTPAATAAQPDLVLVPEQGSDPFDEWWKLYPKKKDKALAKSAYRAAVKKPGVTPALLRAALERQLPTMTDLQYVIYPERWLKRERWTDEPPATQQRRGGYAPDDVRARWVK